MASSKPLNLLKQDGLKPGAGTKLVSRYGVIVVDDGQVGNAIESLRAANLQATLDS
jgi:hypothetical protein